MSEAELSVTKCDPVQSRCVGAAARILGAKWTTQIIYVLANGVVRFSEIEKEIAGINPRTLSARLDELEQEGIVTKTNYNEVPPRIEYELTKKGMDLLPILETMADWGDKYWK